RRRRRQHLRDGRRDHLDGADPGRRSGHQTVPVRDEGAPERVTAQCLQHVGTRQHRAGQPRSTDASERPRAAAMKTMSANRNALRAAPSDAGSALVLAMCLLLVASVIGGAMIMLSQTETYSSMNYRSMTQARYAAESGVHKAINYLLN